MKTVLKALFAVMLAGSHGTVLAQDVTIEVQLVNQAGLDVFFLRDFDITRPASGPTVFRLRIQNSSTSQPPPLGIRMELFSVKYGPLAQGTTRTFQLLPLETVMLTNNDLFTNRGRFRFEDFNYSSDVVDALIRDILATGRLPTDEYTFRFTLIGSGEGSDDIVIRVTNPRKLDLVFPGAPADRRVRDCPMVFTNLPQFRWESDLRLFRVIIAEAKRGEDPQSALNQSPRFVRTFAIRNASNPTAILNRDRFDDILPATSFQFPSSGEVLRLEPGNAYYWRVVGLIETSSGQVPLESEIFCFRIAKLDDVGGKGQRIELLLRQLLGSDFDKLFGDSGELTGYEAKRVTFEGKEVTIAELLSRLPRLRRNYKGYRIE